MGQAIESLAQFAAATQWEDVPVAVREQARLVLVDTFGVMLAGSERPEVRSLIQCWSHATAGPATVFARGWPTQDTRTAALLNGIGGRAIELCEGLRLVSGQVAMQVLPGILALAEARRTSGRDLLNALVVGYEVAGRLCGAFTPRPLAHQNGQACLLGAAAAGARLSGFDGPGISRAMRVCTTLLLTPSYTNVVAGATALNVAGGMSSFAGAVAPDFVQAGFEAQADAIEEALGQMVGAGFEPAHLLDALGERWEITRNYFRLYACCNPIHPALDALNAVLEELRPSPEEVERVDIATYRFAAVMRNAEPPNFFASKYSLPHAAAVLIVRGDLGHASLDDSAVHDARIAAVRTRVHVEEDPAMSALAPRLRPARVTVTLKDGRTASHACESHRGDFNQPFERSELQAKFRELAGCVLTAEGVGRAESLIDAFESVPDVHAALTALGPHVRPR